MQDILMKFGPVVAAGAFAFVIYLVLERFVFRGPRAAKRLGDFVGGATQASGSQVKYGSREHKIRVAFKAYGLEVGLLINFGNRSLQFKRVMKPPKHHPPTQS